MKVREWNYRLTGIDKKHRRVNWKRNNNPNGKRRKTQNQSFKFECVVTRLEPCVQKSRFAQWKKTLFPTQIHTAPTVTVRHLLRFHVSAVCRVFFYLLSRAGPWRPAAASARACACLPLVSLITRGRRRLRLRHARPPRRHRWTALSASRRVSK